MKPNLYLRPGDTIVYGVDLRMFDYLVAKVDTPNLPPNRGPTMTPTAIVALQLQPSNETLSDDVAIWNWVDIGWETRQRIFADMVRLGTDRNRWISMRVVGPFEGAPADAVSLEETDDEASDLRV